MTVQIAIKGVSKLSRRLQAVEKAVDSAAQKGVKDATFFVEGKVKDSIRGVSSETRSVDTGRFLNSVNSKVMEGYGIVKSDVDYAKYLEYGTSKIPARRHFRNVLARSQKKINKIVKDRIMKVRA